MWNSMQQSYGLLLDPYLVIPSLITMFLAWHFIKQMTLNDKKLPPSPAKLPILGNFHQLGELPHRSLQTMAKKHGPLMLLHFGKIPTLIVSSADAAREIMKTHDLTFANRPNSSISNQLLYEGKDLSSSPYGEYWRQLKSVFVVQLLSNKRVQSFHAVRVEEIAVMAEKIRKLSLSSSPVNLTDLFRELANDVVCRTALGRKYWDKPAADKFLHLLTELLELLGRYTVGEFIPSLAWIDRLSGFSGRVDKTAKEIDRFLEGVIEDHWENPSGKDQRKENFVDILLKIYKDNNTGVSIDRNSIKALLLDVFGGGIDTTSTILEWTMAELIKHPTIMKKLQNEVRGVVDGKQDITYNDLEKMSYLRAVVKESLRYHIPVPLLVSREAGKDVNVMGYDIAEGTMVIINAWAIGRDEASWDEPEKFEPNRFMNSSIDVKGLDFELLPFGSGRRGCPGIAFGMTTVELALAGLMQKFDWKLPNGVKGEDLDMSEVPGLATHKTVPLVALATPCEF